MAAAVVAIASMKGGVGKTTLTLSLAEGSVALKAKRVLVVDLDPQINASTLLTSHLPVNNVPWRTGMTVVDFLNRCLLEHSNVRTHQFVQNNLINLRPGKTVSLFSGHYDLRAFERRLLVKSGQTIDEAMLFMQAAIGSILEQQGPLFDLIVFDCPPGFSIITEAALAQANVILLPTAPNNLGVQGLLGFAKYLQDDLGIAQAPQRTHVFLTMTGRTKTARLFEKEVRNEEKKLQPEYRVLESSYRYLDGFQKAMDRRPKPIGVLAALSGILKGRRNRSLFDRLYDGVDGQVAKVVNEVWDVIRQQGPTDERSATRKRARRHHQPEARA
jgi:cellulose biosynthesis protein BcsQ